MKVNLPGVLEPAAEIPGPAELSINLSIAISLKRIADAIEGSPSKLGLAEHLGNTLENSLYNVLRSWRG